MDIAKVVRKLHIAETNARDLRAQLEHEEEMIRCAKAELAYHADRARKGEPPVVISLRYRIFGRREYFLNEDCSITPCSVFRERGFSDD